MLRRRWLVAGSLIWLTVWLPLAGLVHEAGSEPGSIYGEGDVPDPVIVILPLEALADAGLRPYYGFAVSPDEVLVVVPGEAVRPEPRLSPFLARPRSVFKRHLDRPLWVSAARLREDDLEGTAARTVYSGAFSTVVEADDATARHLMERGLTLVRAELRPLQDIRRPDWGQGMLDGVLSLRPLTEARRRFMSGLADSVDTLELRQTIEELAWERKAMEYRSRYSCRLELKEYTAPLLVDRLTGYVTPHGGAVTVAPCLPRVWECPDLPPRNIVAYLPGKKSGAHYIICAHYDATASREPLWDWETDPAPGADDNATGVAVVLECARLLSALELDVGLKFIAFSGEEQGLKGSKCYADSIKLIADSDSVLGVINVDMVGYVKDSDPVLTLAYDLKSRWLSDQLVGAATIAGIQTEIEEVDLTGVPESDHFPFWQIGIPGVLFIEKLVGTVPVNPNYHTTGDTEDHLTLSQVGDNAAVVVSFISRFAPLPEDTLPDIELTSGSVEWIWAGRYLGDPPVAGDSLGAVLRAVNLGTSMAGPEPYEYQVWRGERDAGTLVHAGMETLSLVTGEYTDIEAAWRTGSDTYGEVSYTFVLEPVSPDVESDITNNAAASTIEIMPRSVALENLHVFPNPVTNAAGASIAFEIYHPEGDFDGAVDIWIYEILGRQIGYGRLERSPAKQEIDVGRNVVGLTGLLDAGEPLPPGLYLVVMDFRLLRSNAPITDRFTFAVDR